MTAKDKALELINNFEIKFYTMGGYVTDGDETIKYCLGIVDEIIKALKEYGDTSFELQNMDGEFRFWYEVKKEIEKWKI